MLERITTAGDEPVSLAEAKLAARVDGDDLDTLIAGLISSARKQAEQITGRAYRGGVWRWTGSDWPCCTIPVTGVLSAEVRRWDGSALVLLPSDAYICVESADGPGTDVVPALGAAWPDLPSIAAGARVQIDLTVTRTPGSVEECVKNYIMAHVAAWLKNPEAIASSSLARHPLLDRLLDSERVVYL
jgi:uncharacterized phiE125 gp8 family phage protein